VVVADEVRHVTRMDLATVGAHQRPERCRVGGDPRTDHRRDRRQDDRARRHVVDLRRALKPIADRGLQAIGDVGGAQVGDPGVGRERGQRGEWDVLAPTGEQREHLVDTIELGGHAARSDQPGERQCGDDLAWRFPWIRLGIGRRAARRARYQVELEARHPHHGAEVRREIIGVVTTRLA
jgi:hypothetical protein